MRIPFIDRFRRLAANASGLVSTRLALFSLELQEELERRLGHLVLLLAAFMFGMCTLLFAAVLVLTVAWQYGHLLAAATGLTVFCLACAVICAFCLWRCVRTSPSPFSETLAEFKRDEAALRGKPTSQDADSLSADTSP